jgi:hypothetical protein
MESNEGGMTMTKGELVAKLNLKTFDYALPQTWVDAAYARGWDVVPHFVWCYDQDCEGVPYPLTDEGLRMLGQMAKFI